MLQKITYYAGLSARGILRSYGQVMFSGSMFMGAVLLMVSFFNVYAGMAGVLAVLVAQLTALVFQYPHSTLRDGSYTFNSLLTGLALGVCFKMSLPLMVVIIFASVLSFFLTVWFGHVLSAKGLPFLSLPFLFVIWCVILAGNKFGVLQPYVPHSMMLQNWFPAFFTQTTGQVSALPAHNFWLLYLRAMAAIFFQYGDLTGLVIALGLLLHSRMSFLLSVWGFFIGYMFYTWMKIDFTPLVYTHIGFNFILTAMALGGFFVVSSTRSFLLLILAVPLVAVLINATYSIMGGWGLSLYSMPFSLMVILLIYVLQQRSLHSGLFLVTIQNYSAEKNHYRHYNRIERFRTDTYFHISLPVMGKWYISQGHSGKITHKEDWKYAWDFDVRDSYGKTFDGLGTELTDFNCYDLPVLAPASGYVVEVVDDIDDNLVGTMDLRNNWGNTIVIRHGEHVYSKLSHLKKGSMKCKPGDYVIKGDIIAHCGSSGRSPEPHLHFQLQTTAQIGSKTLLHPISYYLVHSGGGIKLKSFDVPAEGDTVSTVQNSKVLADAFHLTPGKKIIWKLKNKTYQWEVAVNMYNQTYLYCKQSGATAYFVNNGTMFYFTEFYGSKSSLLYKFYLGMHKLLLGHYTGVEVNDILQPEDGFPLALRAVHDATAPFFHYIKTSYTSVYTSANNAHDAKEIELKGNCMASLFGKNVWNKQFVLTITDEGFGTFRFKSNNQILEATCIN